MNSAFSACLAAVWKTRRSRSDFSDVMKGWLDIGERRPRFDAAGVHERRPTSGVDLHDRRF